jgi:multisubunit Na+/H+ antiporter MnhC subunit
MSAHETSSPGTRPAPSPKAVLLTAIIIVFGILHVIAAVLLHDAATTPPVDASRLVTHGN